ncbi:MAG: DNA polymerase III subunit gamma/tau [Sandaracinus sp.]|nr:DNA polymerase III subunit gamma/tau [Sandaracinus sp.]MCB9621469.1 DNA polymerase III subunit gamma/tau [Sandaracinus sp.]MCB9623715.1 DNA polymerase III subunit gamma/tau [Sandaracinus sp.]MCB9634465.1 DNA polymerase III subunit gamma/tau [Sandaracinus sp.]
MAYTVFARKYRPQTLDELVGQEHVARTLSNAIAADRVAHAFLFTGVRGVGKTTTARILAKALNCEKGPTATPCNECAICKDITAGVDMDVQEIDGASNNSVDDVRRLQESLPYRPARDRSKIVIVDEVHMLSTGAFNAFLKTLEEPPPHVKFIFATTESHKVPVTIRSRCQRYDFRLIPQTVVADHVRRVLGSEGITADDDAIALVARESAGSMRDALTLLDQLVAFGGDHLVGEDVARHLGIAGRAALHRALSSVLSGDAAAVLRAIDDTLASGADPNHFVKQLVQTLRDLVVLRVAGDDRVLVDLVDEEREAAQALAGAQDPMELQRVFAIVSKLVDEVAKASSPRLMLEMGLVRAATRPALRDVGELLVRLERLERGGSPPSSSGARSGGARGGEPPRGREPSRSAEAESRPAERASSSSSSSEARPQAPRPQPPRGKTGEKPWEILAREAMARSGGREPESRSSAPAADDDESPPRVSSTPPVMEEEVAPPPPVDDDDAFETDVATGAKVLRPALQEWERLVASLRDAKPALAAVLEHGVPRVVSKERIVLAFQHGSFYGRQAEAPAAKEAIAGAAAKRLGGRPVIEIRFDAEVRGRTVAAIEATRREAERSAKKRRAMSHPAVLDAIEVFPEARGKIDVRIEDD